MDWKEGAKFFVLMVASGVVTAVAIELVTKRLQEIAVLSARAELQKLMMRARAATQKQATFENPETPPEPFSPNQFI